MKSWMKGMLITSAVCIGAGAAMCVSAWAMGGRFSQFRHKRFGLVEEEIRLEEAPVEKTESAEIRGRENPESAELQWIEQVTEESFDRVVLFEGNVIAGLELEVVGANVEVTVDDTWDSIRIICDNPDYQCWQEVDGDTLEIQVRRRKKADLSFMEALDQWDETAVQVIIPAGSRFREADLEVAAGLLTVEELNADSLDLDLKAGTLKVQGGSVGELSGECKAGSLEYKGMVQWEMNADCKAGSIQYLLEGQVEDFNYEIENSVGSILIGGTEQGNVKTEKVIENTGASKYAELECAAGKIQIDFYEK